MTMTILTAALVSFWTTTTPRVVALKSGWTARRASMMHHRSRGTTTRSQYEGGAGGHWSSLTFLTPTPASMKPPSRTVCFSTTKTQTPLKLEDDAKEETLKRTSKASWSLAGSYLVVRETSGALSSPRAAQDDDFQFDSIRFYHLSQVLDPTKEVDGLSGSAQVSNLLTQQQARTSILSKCEPDAVISIATNIPLQKISTTLTTLGPTSNEGGPMDVLADLVARVVVSGIYDNHAVTSSRKSATQSSEWTVEWEKSGESASTISRQTLLTSTRVLFDFEKNQGIEFVDMADQNSQSWGPVPRSMVHRHNILHRGMGLFVTNTSPDQLVQYAQSLMNGQTVSSSSLQTPLLYVHQRTATKRVFPSLYDMFVGGISLEGEDTRETALREVAEELGLTHEDKCGAEFEDVKHMGLSRDPILRHCLVCTSYNRCVVDLFVYTLTGESSDNLESQQEMWKDQITWQPEEVAWGDFVPYNAVVLSAVTSIQRLLCAKKWPGQIPPKALVAAGADSVVDNLEMNRIKPDSIVNNESLMEWDYVPDGLLVWEAWIDFLREDQ